MKKYAVKRTDKNKVIAILNYDEKNKEFTIDIPEDVYQK